MMKDKEKEVKVAKQEEVKVLAKIGFVSLGCDKNRVDTENIITTLSCYKQFEFVYDKTKADVIIINTCAFLQSAREEANGIIEEMAELKKSGSLKKLVVAGCLPLLDKQKVKKEHPLVDEVVVPNEYRDIDKIIFKLLKIKNLEKNNTSECRMLTTPRHYAYLKIADGCNNRCAYCKIPFIRGNYQSLPMEEIVAEATALSEHGVKEFILVAQDITRYGMDLYKDFKLSELLNKLLKVKKLAWIRLLYCYPDMIDDDFIKTVADNPKVLKYLDIPLQHISNNVLKAMKRRGSKQDIINLITKLRNEIPEIKIRTTFMVGFPGETKKDFNELIDFLKTYKLDNVGFFKYSREEGTSSYDLPNQVDEKEKDRRLLKAQKVQQKIADENNKKMIGEVFKVICDSYDEKHKFFVGRPYFSAPDIDFEVLFTSYSRLTKVGGFAEVKITDYSQGYFIGEMVYDENYT